MERERINRRAIARRYFIDDTLLALGFIGLAYRMRHRFHRWRGPRFYSEFQPRSAEISIFGRLLSLSLSAPTLPGKIMYDPTPIIVGPY